MTSEQKIVMGIFAGDLAWILGGIFLISIGAVTPDSMLSGAIFEFGTLVEVWIAAGGILGIATFVSILDAFGSIFSGSGF